MEPRHAPRRRVFVVFPALVAAAAASAAIAIGAPGGGPPGAAVHASAHDGGALTARQVNLRQDMRMLWEEHIAWTRQVIVDFAAGLPSLTTSEVRLLRNQVDIGNAIAPFYGRTAGARLTSLLRGHILLAVDVLVAARAGDAPALAQAQARWTANADRIADFLSHANPTAWPRAEMRAMMHDHLRLTTDEAVARLSGDWAADVRAYGGIQAQILHMADILSAGIIEQFPRRFGPAG